MLVFCGSVQLSLRFLIYPYWNVNINDVKTNKVENRFLIYPYWNVNLINMHIVVYMLYRF